MRIFVGIAVALGLLFVGYYGYLRLIGNPGVMAELRSDPHGVRAERVMLITLPDDTVLPVNYLREGEVVFIGVDGLWWRQFRDGPATVSLLIQGEELTGKARAILDDPAYTNEVFARLRPTAPTWLPGRMRGVLVEIELDQGA